MRTALGRAEVRDGDERVVLVVSDTGIGIPEDDIPQCFKEFYRGENATQLMYEGTGLGLSIVKRTLINTEARWTSRVS